MKGPVERHKERISRFPNGPLFRPAAVARMYATTAMFNSVSAGCGRKTAEHRIESGRTCPPRAGTGDDVGPSGVSPAVPRFGLRAKGWLAKHCRLAWAGHPRLIPVGPGSLEARALENAGRGLERCASGRSAFLTERAPPISQRRDAQDGTSRGCKPGRRSAIDGRQHCFRVPRLCLRRFVQRFALRVRHCVLVGGRLARDTLPVSVSTPRFSHRRRFFCVAPEKVVSLAPGSTAMEGDIA
jgi:hypothetical protein